jgi:adenine deaminase
VRVAISQGVPPLTAIQMATINTAEHFGLAQDIGMIAPGRFADILLVKDLDVLDIELVIAKGVLAAQAGKLLIDLPAYEYPSWALDSVHLKRELIPEMFVLPAPDVEQLTANVIGVIENQAPTRHLRLQVSVRDKQVPVDLRKDIVKIAVIERHKGTGEIQVGLVHGFGFNVSCAVGTTVAHDSHHMIVAGTDEADMALAANELAKMGGGQIVVREGVVIGKVDLPIGGLMSNERADIVAEKAASILEGFEACGCELNNPNMQLSLLALVVIPELRISDIGLVDVNRFELIPVLEN